MTAPAPEGTAMAAAMSGPETTTSAYDARRALYDAATPYADKASLATALSDEVRAAVTEAMEAGPASAIGERALAVATLLVEWSMATLSYAAISTKAGKKGGGKGGGGGGKGAKKGALGGGDANASAAPSGPRAPKAIGADPPPPKALVVANAQWRALATGLSVGRHAPNAAAVAHVTRAAATAAASIASDDDDDDDDDDDVPTSSNRNTTEVVSAHTLADVLRALAEKCPMTFSPSADYLVSLAVLSLRSGARFATLAEISLRLFVDASRDVFSTTTRDPPKMTMDDADALLNAAGAERAAVAGTAGKENAWDVDVKDEGVACGAVRALLSHPAHLNAVPAAFAEAERRRNGTSGVVAANVPAREKEIPIPPPEAGTEPTPMETDDGDDDAKEKKSKSPPKKEKPKPPAFLVGVASRILSAAGGDHDTIEDANVARLLPWCLDAFVARHAKVTRAKMESLRMKALHSKTAAKTGTSAASGLPTATLQPAALLFDALFAVFCVEARAGGDDGNGGGDGGGGASRRGEKRRGKKPSAASPPGPGPRLFVAADLLNAYDALGLFSPASSSYATGPAPDRPTARDRLKAFASRVAATATRDWRGAASASLAIMDRDFRLLEEHSTEIIAAIVDGGGASAGAGSDADADATTRDRDRAIASEAVARFARAFAKTRRLPEALGAVGGAVARLTRARSPHKGEGVLDAEIVIEAMKHATKNMPSGQVAEVLTALHAAMSLALGSFDAAAAAAAGGGDFGGGGAARVAAAERVAATCALVAESLGATPIPPGENLLPPVADALAELLAELRGRLLRWRESARLDGVRASKKHKKSRDDDATDDPIAVATNAAVAGALLRVYTPAYAIVEVGHDGWPLHQKHAIPYLGEETPPLSEFISPLLRAEENARAAGTRAVSARSTAAAAAGATLHRIAQLGRVARPPPGGHSDQVAGAEARELTAALLRFSGGGGSAEASPETSSVAREFLDRVPHYWTDWATEEALRECEWVVEGGIDVFEVPRLLTVWTREACAWVLDASAATLAAAAGGGGDCGGGDFAAAVVDAAKVKLRHGGPMHVRNPHSDDADVSKLFDPTATTAAATAFWKDAARNFDGGGGGGGAASPSKKKPKTSEGAPMTLHASLLDLKAALERLSTLHVKCTVWVDIHRVHATCAAADCASHVAAVCSSRSRDDDDDDVVVLDAALDACGVARDVFTLFANRDRGGVGSKLAKSICVAATLASSKLVDATTRSRKSTAVGQSLKRATFATARLLHAGLIVSSHKGLARAEKVVAPLARGLLREARALKKTKPGGGAIDAGMVPRALRMKRAAAAAASAEDASIPPDVSPRGVFAAAVAEAMFIAALDGTRPPKKEENERFTAEEPDEEAGVQASTRWKSLVALRGVVHAASSALARVSDVTDRRVNPESHRDLKNYGIPLDEPLRAHPVGLAGDGVVEALSGCLRAVAASCALAAIVVKHAPAKHAVAPSADALRETLSIALAALTRPCGADGSLDACWVCAHPGAAAKAADALEAVVRALQVAGPRLTANAHAALVASVVVAYDVAARGDAARKAKQTREDPGRGNARELRELNALPAPVAELRRALGGAMTTLMNGAGKRLVGQAYRMANDRIRACDAVARRLYSPWGKLAGLSLEDSSLGWDLTASLAAPLWTIATCVDHAVGDDGSRASRAAMESSGEHCLISLMDVCRMGTEEGLGEVGGPASRAAANAAIVILTSIVSRSRLPLSKRAVARATQLTHICFHGGLMKHLASVPTVFSPCCALLVSIIRARKAEMARQTAMITVACHALLDALKAWNAIEDEKNALAERTKTPRDEEEVAIHEEAMRRAANSMAPVYESAGKVVGSLYAMHLLADAVAACCGGGAWGGDDDRKSGDGYVRGIGAVAESALKPGIFALFDAVQDRELQQLYTMFGNAMGGALRLKFKALIDEYRLVHKYDPKKG